MSFLEKKIYPLLPVPFQNLALSVYGYFWYKRRFGGVFLQEMQDFKKREFFTRQQWRDFQTVELRKLLIHAFQSVPFYQEKYKIAGFTLSDFKRFELEGLEKLPFLEKEELRKYGRTKLLSTVREKGWRFYSSSGSTGTPTQILYSQDFHQRLSAVMETRVRNWAGVNWKDPRGMIGGRRIIPKASNQPPFYRYNWFENQTYFSAYHISMANASDYLKGMRKHGVKYMTGYAMSNYFLASFLQKNELEAPTMKAVITSSEKLTPHMRKVISEVYSCRVFDSYSGVENCGLISESPEGNLLSSPDVGLLEVVDEQGKAVSPGQEGEVVSTGFLNYDQPLIRYKIGDRVRLGQNQNTPCGRQMPVIDEIVGRNEDTIITKDGRQMVRFHGIFLDLPHVLEGQVIQQGYTQFLLKVVVVKGFSNKEENLMINRMKSQIGDDAIIEVRPVEEIPRNANGKFQAVISEMSL